MKTSTTVLTQYDFHFTEEEMIEMKNEIKSLRLMFNRYTNAENYHIFQTQYPTIFDLYQKLSSYL